MSLGREYMVNYSRNLSEKVGIAAAILYDYLAGENLSNSPESAEWKDFYPDYIIEQYGFTPQDLAQAWSVLNTTGLIISRQGQIDDPDGGTKEVFASLDYKLTTSGLLAETEKEGGC